MGVIRNIDRYEITYDGDVVFMSLIDIFDAGEQYWFDIESARLLYVELGRVIQHHDRFLPP